VIGLLYPGEMGAAVGSVLRGEGRPVLWASAGRGPATVRRAEEADLRDVGTVAELIRRSDVILSICPPHAATEVAQAVAGFTGVFVDANAVSPATARVVGALVEAGGARFVDGGIIGPPPMPGGGSTRLYLSGPHAGTVAELFAGTALEPRIVSAQVGAASAVKMAYAGWTKGTAALLLALRAMARAEDVEETLLAEWRESQPDLPEQSQRAARSADLKGWRWVGEMEEIAAAMASAGLPDGFHKAAAEVFAVTSRTAAPPPEPAARRSPSSR
jgi:3-hydroxyisobutyrate dehydrogenase-like beta-hydroxyacid dehydrogenase